MKKNLICFVAAISLSLNSFAVAQQKVNEVVIGVLHPLTGPVAQIGLDSIAALKTAVEIVNEDINLDMPFAKGKGLPGLKGAKIRLVIAFPDKYRYKNLDEMVADYGKKKKTLRISSEYLTTASKFLKQLKSYKKYYGSKDPLIVTPWMRLGNNKNVQIHLSFGATEAKPPEDVDAIMDVTETGTTLKQNKLKIVDEVLTSTAHLIVNKKSLKDPKKREKIYDIVTLMKGAVIGRKYLHIYLNVEEKNLKKLLSQMPSLKKPTISPLSEDGWFGINTVIKKEEYHKLIPKLRKIAQGLVVHEPRQILELEEIKRDEEN